MQPSGRQHTRSGAPVKFYFTVSWRAAVLSFHSSSFSTFPKPQHDPLMLFSPRSPTTSDTARSTCRNTKNPFFHGGCLALALLCAASTQAEVKLPLIFSDHAVLQ